jgi:hypothetical protein
MRNGKGVRVALTYRKHHALVDVVETDPCSSTS